MTLIQLLYIRLNQRGAGLDAAVIAIHGRMLVGGLAREFVEQVSDVSMQGAVISFERQDVIPLILDNFLGDVAPAI